MSTFSEKLMQLRKARGFSQEQLGERVDVSRQTVSKWESGQTTPEMDKLIALADLFGVTIDELAGRKQPGRQEPAARPEAPPHSSGMSSRWWYETVYEYKSERKVLGVPLVHIHFGHGNCRARGIIAIGNAAMGIVAVGFASIGVVSAGIAAIGLLTLGLVGIGVIALGGVVMGILAAIGGVAASAGLAMGAIACGTYAIGRIASGYFAAGTVAAGHIAIGPDADGALIFGTAAEALSQLGKELPGWLRLFLRFMK